MILTGIVHYKRTQAEKKKKRSERKKKTYVEISVYVRPLKLQQVIGATQPTQSETWKLSWLYHISYQKRLKVSIHQFFS